MQRLQKEPQLKKMCCAEHALNKVTTCVFKMLELQDWKNDERYQYTQRQGL